MSSIVPGSPFLVKQPYASSTLKPKAVASTISLDSVDSFSKTRPAPPAAPRFTGWMTLLPFVSAGLSMGRNHIDRSMQRDEYERNKRKRYYTKSTYSDDRGHKYRTITMLKAYDYNDTRKRHEDTESAGPWHYRRRRYR